MRRTSEVLAMSVEEAHSFFAEKPGAGWRGVSPVPAVDFKVRDMAVPTTS